MGAFPRLPFQLHKLVNLFLLIHYTALHTFKNQIICLFICRSSRDWCQTCKMATRVIKHGGMLSLNIKKWQYRRSIVRLVATSCTDLLMNGNSGQRTFVTVVIITKYSCSLHDFGAKYQSSVFCFDKFSDFGRWYVQCFFSGSVSTELGSLGDISSGFV